MTTERTTPRHSASVELNEELLAHVIEGHDEVEQRDARHLFSTIAGTDFGPVAPTSTSLRSR